LDVDAVADRLAQIRAFTDMPIGVGFGIKDAATAARIARIADAVVVGSALVRIIEAANGDEDRIRCEVAALLAEMRSALDGISHNEAKGQTT
ncbi:MAG: tryptophan synthase subunit alpha, partial [Gammaproteobacteria bacterium]